jgi:2-polyprenyl-6-methoxyphenol hydroxylase-like FAD-dependent oxidoreductase
VSRPSTDRVRVQGSGLVGMALSLALARAGLRVEWAAASGADPPAGPDVRAYALNPASVDLLRTLRVWDAMPAGSITPVRDMRIAGDAAGALLEFTAWQQRVGELAWIVDAAELEQVMRQAIGFAPGVVTLPSTPPSAAAAPPALVAHVEGKHSAAREALGVRWTRHDYGQVAVAARLVADRPHAGAAWQWFRSPDVLALLPFDRPQPDRSFALVWSLPAAEARRILALSPEAFCAALHDATGGAAGALRVAGERVGWPLALARADRWCGPGWVLLGDAAHVVHPLAGQGLNLGLADVSELARVLAAREPWRPLGDERLLRRYERARQAPTAAMARMTDGLLHLFATDAGPIRLLRNRGLDLVNHAGWLKRWLAERALHG